MIKIVDSGHGVRLMYEDIEVLNHSTVMPFAKSLICHAHYFKKKGVPAGYIDTEGEFALTDYEVKSVSTNSAHIEFKGYDETTLDIAVVEEKDRLVLHLSSTSKSIRLNFITGAIATIMLNGEEVNGKLSTNIVKTKLPIFKLVTKKDVAFEDENNISFLGKTMSMKSQSLIEYDFTKHASGSISFMECPKEIIVKKQAL